MLSALERLKAQRELQTKPFPLWALLVICENGHRNDWYCNYFEGFKILVNWLGPIEIPKPPSSLKIPRLQRTYEIQEISRLLNTSQESIYHGYQTAITKLQLTSHTSQLSSQVSTEANGS